MADRISAREIAMLAGGMAAGIIGSRLLPPLLVQAVGSVRSRFGEDPFEPLIRDHRYIVSVLNDMENVSAGSTVHRMKLYLSLKRTLAKHAMAEEDVVYPLLHDEGGDPQSSKHLYSEHADMKIHLYELEQLIKKSEDWTANVRSLRDLIQKHIHEEEQVEFPKLRRMLDEHRNGILARHIRREEAMVL